MAEKTVYLHVGQGKTGSSYIQSAFALSIDTLAQNGIEYPIDERSAARAGSGLISSGNVLPTKDSFEEVVTKNYTQSQPSLLLSNEGLFDLMQKENLHQILAKNLPDHRIKLIVFIRDPLEHAVSAYHQIIKRGGYTESFDKFLEKFSRLARDRKVFRRLSQFDMDMTIKNYSRHKKTVLAVMEEFLSLPEGALKKPEVDVVNRSLTRAELELQRAFNVHFGHGTSGYVSDRFCNRLPEIPSEKPIVSRESLKGYLDSSREHANVLARYISEEERHYIPDVDEAMASFEGQGDDDSFSFSAAQLDTFVSGLQEFIKIRVNQGKNG